MQTKEIAKDLLLGNLDVESLIDDVDFLKEVDNSILVLTRDESGWSDAVMANKRKQIMDKIATILNEQEEEENVSGLQRTNRPKRKLSKAKRINS